MLGSRAKPMAEPEVSAVVVTHNAAPWIERSLGSLQGTGAEVIVVDNASTDGTPELVRGAFPEAHVIEQENRGFQDECSGKSNANPYRSARVDHPAPRS